MPISTRTQMKSRHQATVGLRLTERHTYPGSEKCAWIHNSLGNPHTHTHKIPSELHERDHQKTSTFPGVCQDDPQGLGNAAHVPEGAGCRLHFSGRMSLSNGALAPLPLGGVAPLA